MGRIYEYKGSVAGHGDGEIMLYVHRFAEVSPIKLSVPKALSKYIEALYGTDSEEKYYDKIFKYDNLLILHEIVIPAHDAERNPAKIITQARVTSEEPLIFGEPEHMETPEKQLEPMSGDEYRRYLKFRYENCHDTFFHAE